MDFLSISQLSKQWGISPRRIQVLCAEGRIEGAIKVGYSWVIPADAKKPSDGRIKTGKYIKKSEMEREVQ